MQVIWYKTEPVFHIILHGTSFLIQTASLFVHGETFNQKESMLVWQVAGIAGCVRSFILVHWILVFLATPARTTNKTRLNVSLITVWNVCKENIKPTVLTYVFCTYKGRRD